MLTPELLKYLKEAEIRQYFMLQERRQAMMTLELLDAVDQISQALIEIENKAMHRQE